MLDELQKETVLSMILDPLEEIFGRLMRTRLMQIEITEMIQKKSYYKHHMEIQDLLRFFLVFPIQKTNCLHLAGNSKHHFFVINLNFKIAMNCIR